MRSPLQAESAPSFGRNRAADSAWLVSTEARQDAQEADTYLADDDWLYTPPELPAATPRPHQSGHDALAADALIFQPSSSLP